MVAAAKKSATASLSRVQLEALLEQLAVGIMQVHSQLDGALSAIESGDKSKARALILSARTEVVAMSQTHDRACKNVEQR